MEQKCTMCGEVKTLELFSKDAGAKRGVKRICKVCDSERAKKYYRENRESLLEKSKKYHLENKGIAPSRQKEYYRNVHLKRTYSMTLDEYNKMLSDQGGVCKICGQLNQNDWSLYVDHDHSCCLGAMSCGKCTRGLLCRKCNTGLANFQDDPELLLRAAAYIRGKL